MSVHCCSNNERWPLLLAECLLSAAYLRIIQHKQPPTTTDGVCRGTLINYTFRNFDALKTRENRSVALKDAALKRLHVDAIKRLLNESSILSGRKWRRWIDHIYAIRSRILRELESFLNINRDKQSLFNF